MKFNQLIPKFNASTTLYFLLLSTFFSLYHNLLHAQNDLQAPANFTDSAYLNAVKAYDLAIARNSFLYTGRVYNTKYGSIKNHPYFLDDYWEEGKIVYQGQPFDSVYMMYEIYSDLVLIEGFTTKGALTIIKLHSPDVSAFSLHGHHFVRLNEDTLQNFREGFYDQLYDGQHVQLYCKRIKAIVKNNDVNTVAESFFQKDKYYIRKEGQYFQVKKKKSVLKVLHDHKKELRAFANNNRLYFADEQEQSILSMVQFYDSLNEL